MKFVDVKNDVAFRKIFGNQNKTEIIISFINAILDLPEGKKIVTVTIPNPYQLPVIKDLKASIIDVKVTDQSGFNYLVEMQVEEKIGFDKRMQYYTSKEYVSQIDRGESYPKLKPVVLIAILDYNFSKGKDYVSKHLILDTKTHEHLLKDLSFNFIELEKFDKKLEEITSLSDKWIYFLKHSYTLDKIPKHIIDKGLTEAYTDANTHSWTKQELSAYDYASMRKQDEMGKFTFQYEKGIKKGIEQGIKQERKKTIDLLRSLNFSNEKIAENLGVSINEIEKS